MRIMIDEVLHAKEMSKFKYLEVSTARGDECLVT
jgi:hypothetical protein